MPRMQCTSDLLNAGGAARTVRAREASGDGLRWRCGRAGRGGANPGERRAGHGSGSGSNHERGPRRNELRRQPASAATAGGALIDRAVGAVGDGLHRVGRRSMLRAVGVAVVMTGGRGPGTVAPRPGRGAETSPAQHDEQERQDQPELAHVKQTRRASPLVPPSAISRRDGGSRIRLHR
jgi:hypothetical protein